ncbi:MAG: 6-bladed beta-propeller [Gemmatimonadales bacterium]
MNLPSPHAVIASALWLVAGCGNSGGPRTERLDTSTRGPTLVVVDSAVLAESDTISIGAYSSFFVRTASGQMVVNDMQQARLLQFGPDGRFVRSLGARGDGPGEFSLPGPMGVLPDDTTLVVLDVNARRGARFALTSGDYLGQFATTFPDAGTQWSFVGDTVVMAVNGAQELLARWPLLADTAEALGLVPPRLRGALSLRMAYGRSELVVRESSVVALLPTEPGLDIFDRRLEHRGIVLLPAVRRKGEPLDLAARQRAVERGDDQSLASSAVGLHRLPSGTLVAVHLDMTVIRDRQRNSRQSDVRLFASLISPDLSQACLDGEVPITTDVPPIPAFRGDTMFVLARQVQADDTVRSVVYGFRFDAAGCDWVPTGGLTSLPA